MANSNKRDMSKKNRRGAAGKTDAAHRGGQNRASSNSSS
jgi:hypothetical protein